MHRLRFQLIRAQHSSVYLSPASHGYMTNKYVDIVRNRCSSTCRSWSMHMHVQRTVYEYMSLHLAPNNYKTGNRSNVSPPGEQSEPNSYTHGLAACALLFFISSIVLPLHSRCLASPLSGAVLPHTHDFTIHFTFLVSSLQAPSPPFCQLTKLYHPGSRV